MATRKRPERWGFLETAIRSLKLPRQETLDLLARNRIPTREMTIQDRARTQVRIDLVRDLRNYRKKLNEIMETEHDTSDRTQSA